ncbi:hypothetical protein Btru_031499 [Bulinus truncatus]|nr:hypothetical protein Btru_031499 [Bulinus truncatus]
MKTVNIRHKLDGKKLSNSEEEKNSRPNDSLVIAAQSVKKIDSVAGGKIHAAQLSSPPPREKTKRHRSSELPKGDHLESKHHSRRHTVDGQHLSSKWAETTHGVSYLDSRMWRSVIKDSIPDERTIQDFEEPQKHSAPSSCKSERSSLSGELMENARSEFKIKLPGQYNRNHLGSSAGKGGSSGRNQSLTSPVPEAWLAPVSHCPEEEGVGCSLDHGCDMMPNLSTQPSHKILSTCCTAQTPDSITAGFGEDASEEHLYRNVNQSECDPDVKKWLLGLDLQSVDHYFQLFSEHQMDIASVRLLTTNALREMGINALGPIMKIMKGVQVLCRREILTQDQAQVVNLAESTPENVKLGTSEIGNAASLHTSVKESTAELSKSNISDRYVLEKISPSGTEEMLKNHQSEAAKQETKGTLSGLNGIQSSADKVDKNPATRKASGETGKRSRNKVTGKPPVAGKVADDGIASAAKKFAVKHQEQIKKQEMEEKSASLRKQMRDEMAGKHLLRRSSSLERKTGETGGLIRSSSFTCVKSPSDEPVQKIVAKGNVSHMKKKAQEKVCPENFSIEDTDAHSEHTQLDRWSSADIQALKKQLNDLEVNIAHQEQEFKFRTSLTLQVGHSQGQSSSAVKSYHDKTSLDYHGTRQQQLSQNEDADTVPDFTKKFQEASEDLKSKFYHGSLEEISVNGVIKKSTSTKKLAPLYKEIEKPYEPVKDKSTSATVVGTMGTAGNSFSFKRNSDYRDLTGSLKSQTKTRPDFSVTGFHIEDLKKVKLDKNDVSFSEKDMVGDGTYSQVFKGSYQDKVVAVKRLKFPLQPTDKNYFAAEVSLLQKLHHPNVVALLGVCSIRKLPHIVLEYVAGGSLRNFLHDDTRIDFVSGEFYQIATDISSGVHYLHIQHPPVLHLDLNSRNVLLGLNLRAKIADFGFSKLKHEVDTALPKLSKLRQVSGGLPSWMAPELTNAGEVTAKADVYSFAIIMWEMLAKKLPYEGCSVYQVLEQVRNNRRPVIPDHCPPDLSRLVQKCWDQNPAARPETLSASQHWRAPDQLLSPSVREDLATSSLEMMPICDGEKSEQAVNTITAVQSSEQVCYEEPSRSLELKSMSSESDSDSLIFVEDTIKLHHNTAPENTAPEHMKNDFLVPSGSGHHPTPAQKNQPSQVLPDKSNFACNVISVSNSTSNNIPQRLTRNSFSLPGQVTSKSTDYLKSSHSAGDRLLPLRHSMDKPKTLPVIPVSTKEKISRTADDEALSGLLQKYSNMEKNRSSAEVSSNNLFSSSFNQKSKIDTDPTITLQSSDSMKNVVSSVENSPSVDVFKNDDSKSTLINNRQSRLSHSSEGQSYVPSFYEEAHFTQSKSHRGKVPFVKGNQTNVTPLPDTCDKLDIKLPTESVLYSLAEVSPISSKVKMSGDIQSTFRTVERPKISQFESHRRFEAKVNPTSEIETTINMAIFPQNASVDSIGCSDARLIADKTDVSLHQNLQSSVMSTASSLTESFLAVPTVYSHDMTKQTLIRNTAGSSLTKLTSHNDDDAHPSVNYVTDQDRKVSSVTDKISPCVSDKRLSVDISKVSSSGSDVKVLSYVKSSLRTLTDSDDSSDLDTISVDSLSLEPGSQPEEKTSPGAGSSLPKSHEETPSPKRELSVRTSSPKPYPTKSSKYSPVKVASLSPSRTHEKQLASSTHSSREKFCLFEQPKEFQPFYFGEGKQQINEHDIIVVPTSHTPTEPKVVEPPVNLRAVNGEHNEKCDTKFPSRIQAAPIISLQNSVPSLGHGHAQKKSVPPAPALDLKAPSSHGHSKSAGSKERSGTTCSQQHAHLLQGQGAPQQPFLQYKKSTAEHGEPAREPAGRFSLEASMLKMQKGQLRSVTTREPPPLNSVFKEIDDGPVFSVANILKKALIDRRFAMGVNHDSADLTPDASWSFQDEEL